MAGEDSWISATVTPSSTASTTHCSRSSKPPRQGVIIIAIGVDSNDDAGPACRDLDLRVGTFFFEAVGARRLRGPAWCYATPGRAGTSEQLIRDVERVLTREPFLVLRMLSIVNSGVFRLPKRIDTTRSALVMLGLRNLRQLALAVTMNSVTSRVPAGLRLTALIRARQYTRRRRDRRAARASRSPRAPAPLLG